MQKILKIGLILILVVFSSCKTKQIATKTPATTPQNQILSVENVVNQVIKSQTELSFVNIARAETNISLNGRSFYVVSNVKIVKNEETAISIAVLGMEVLRVQFKPTNFYIFDKLHHQYCENTYEYLSDVLGAEISYHTIENLLTNQLFTISKESSKIDLTKAFRITQLPDKYILTEIKKAGNFTHFFDVLPDFVVAATSLNQDAKEILSVKYSDFDIKNGALFPMKIDINANFKGSNLSAIFEIKKLEINKKIEISQMDISRYKKVNLKDILMF